MHFDSPHLSEVGEYVPQTRPIIVWDIETTGLNPLCNRISEIALVELSFVTTRRLRQFVSYVHSNDVVDASNTARLTGNTQLRIADAPSFSEVWEKVLDFVKAICAGRAHPILVAHNVSFDLAFLNIELERVGKTLPDWDFVCSMEDIARPVWPLLPVSLQALVRRLGIQGHEPHCALSDVIATSAMLEEAAKIVRLRRSSFCEIMIPLETLIWSLITKAADRRRRNDFRKGIKSSSTISSS